MTVTKFVKNLTKALISFFQSTAGMSEHSCPAVQALKALTTALVQTRIFVIDPTPSRRDYFVKELDAATDKCLKLAPSRATRKIIRDASAAFRDAVLLDEESDSESDSEELDVKKLTK